MPLLVLRTRNDPAPICQILNAPVYLTWVLEGCGRANSLKPIQWLVIHTLPCCTFTHTLRILLFGFLARTYGIVWWGNIWFYLHYLWSPIGVYAASDQRLLQLNYARTILPSMVLTCLLPIFVIISNRQAPLADHIYRRGHGCRSCSHYVIASLLLARRIPQSAIAFMMQRLICNLFGLLPWFHSSPFST